jgi:ribosomal protein S25
VLLCVLPSVLSRGFYFSSFNNSVVSHRRTELKLLNRRPHNPYIGLKNESELHRALKFHYSGYDGITETVVGGYVCDAQTSSGEIIEVQTGSFGPLKEKAKFLAENGKVRIIHPIIVQKHIELYDNEGKLIRRRKSPRQGSVWDLFNALIYAPELPLLQQLSVELALVDIVEKRINDGAGSWRRKGASITGRSLGAWHQSLVLQKPKDYRVFIPFKGKEHFTVRSLALAAGISASVARKTVYVLSKMGLIERMGKQGNAIVYAMAYKKRQKKAER